MPKERFHLYLADEVLNSCGSGLSPAAVSGRLAFYIGAVSPDILFYEFPSFSLSPLGDSLHDLMDLEGISIIGDWRESGRGDTGRKPSRVCHDTAAGPNGCGLSASAFAWALGFACHFLADAAWHPVINELSASMDYCAAKRLSEIECHRLLESELEALRLAGARAHERYARLLRELRRRDLLFEIASYYRQFLAFTGLGPIPTDEKIVKCYLSQNFFLRLFANATLGKLRDRMLDLPFMRYLGSLVTPARPILPPLFQLTFPQDRNPFSDYFMEQALTLLKVQLHALAKRLS
jgi:hypothetical protein